LARAAKAVARSARRLAAGSVGSADFLMGSGSGGRPGSMFGAGGASAACRRCLCASRPGSGGRNEPPDLHRLPDP
jgi:hypothetical protein